MPSLVTPRRGPAVVANIAQHLRKEVTVKVWKPPTIFPVSIKGRLEDVRDNAIWIATGKEKRGVDVNGLINGLRLTLDSLLEYNDNKIPRAALSRLKTSLRFTIVCMWRVKVPRPIKGITFNERRGQIITSIQLAPQGTTIYEDQAFSLHGLLSPPKS